MKNDEEFLISPDLENDNLTKEIEGINEAGESIKLPVIREIPLTIYLNKQEIVTAMTLGDMPDLLAVGYLLNQNMLKKNDVISEVTYDDDLQVVIVRTKRKTNYDISQNSLKIVYVSSILDYKNHKYLLSAINNLPTEKKVSTYFIGEGDPSLIKKLKAQSENNKGNKFYFLGFFRCRDFF